jgi:choline dehydrogenase-like flavoprotein
MSWDVVVVGAGAGGPVVAKELAARGLAVLMLEGGPRFADPEKEWSRYENDANSLTDGYFRVGPTGRFATPAWFREQPQASHVWQVTGVGGTTLHYYANSLRAYPGVFEGYSGADAARYDRAHRFPFSYDSFRPYYSWVEDTLPVAPAPMGTKESFFFRGAERVGLPLLRGKDVDRDGYRPQPNAILPPVGTAGRTSDSARLLFPEAQGCTFCGYCFQGCVQPRRAPRNLKAKRSTDNSYVPMALTASAWAPSGRDVVLRSDAQVVQVHTEQRSGRRRATGVTWRDTRTGERVREEARVVVLAGGCVETPRLWLNSGLPNSNGWVGRGFTDHAFDMVFGVFDEYVGSSKGTGSSARADFPGRGALEHIGLPPALQAFGAAFSDSGVREAYANGRGVTGPWDGPTGRLVGPALKEAMSDVDKVMSIVLLTDDDVEEQNRVELSGLPGDEHGPVPKVVFSKRGRSARTLANREFLAARAAELIRAAGARRVFRMDWPPLILHVQSTMRMGHDPADSVLDATGRAREVEALYVADNSALPNALGGPNPTLTTQALATRTAEELFVREFGGDRWVGQEAPVVSTDPAVTAAVLTAGL